jgi:hypothetical protein
VGLHGLAGDEQPLGDLRVGQADADQPQHLGLPLGQRADALRPGPDRGAERAQQGAGLVRLASRRQPFEAGQRGSGLGDRDLGGGAGEQPGELQPGLRQLGRPRLRA